MSLFGSLFGGTPSPSPSSATPKANPVLYGSTRLCMSGAQGLTVTLAEEKKMFSDAVVRSKLLGPEEPLGDGAIFCMVNVSSSDRSVRIGDVVAVWGKFLGGQCMTAEIQEDKAPASTTASSLFNKLKSMSVSGSSSSSSSTSGAAAGVTTSPFGSSPAAASVPAVRRIKWVKEDLGALSWFVVASPMDDRAQDKVSAASSGTWTCAKCRAGNAFTKKACEGCQVPRPAPTTPVVQVGDRVHLLPFTNSSLVLHVGDAGLSLEPYSHQASGITLSALSEPQQQVPGQSQAGAAGQRKATLSEKVIAAGVVNILKEATFGAQYAAANPLPGSDPLVNAAVASAAPQITRAAEDRYARDPGQALRDLQTAANVADRVMANPVAQRAASAFLTMAAAGINAAATGAAAGSSTTTTTTITSFK